MEIKKLFMVLIALLMLAAPVANAADARENSNYLTISSVKVNGDDAENGDILYVERGETLDLRVTLVAGSNDVENAQVNAFIAGYKYNKYESDLVSDFSKTFDLPAGNKRSFDLSMEVPLDMEQKDAKLRIIVMDENSPEVIIYNYQLNIEGADEENAIQIRDFLISPSEKIEAGRALSFKVKVKNIGESDLDDVTVKVSIPELDVSAYETIDEIEVDETQSFEALLLRIPADADPGQYEVVTTVEFDKYEEVQETKTITVTAPKTTTGTGSPSGNSVVTMPESIELVKGTSGTVYPVLIQNMGETSKTYVMSVKGTQEWATTAFEPSSVVIVRADESKTVYLKIMPNADVEAGDKVFQVSITSGDDTKETSVVASVKEGNGKATSSTSLKTVLEWALIILIIVLIILGLVLVFVKMRKGGKEEEEAQTYY